MYSAADLAAILSGRVGRPVVDGTGLTGLYDFSLDFAPEPSVSATNRGPSNPELQSGQVSAPEAGALGGAPSLAAAIEQQLGLKFESRKGPIDILVVDHIERVPKEN
jgi:uncharacterized protein (TIGR03435 family)